MVNTPPYSRLDCARKLFVALIVSYVAVLVSPSRAGDVHEVERYLGKYEIYDVRKIGGGVTSDAWASNWLGSVVRIERAIFIIRDDLIKSPYYKYEVIKLQQSDGDVG